LFWAKDVTSVPGIPSLLAPPDKQDPSHISAAMTRSQGLRGSAHTPPSMPGMARQARYAKVERFVVIIIFSDIMGVSSRLALPCTSIFHVAVPIGLVDCPLIEVCCRILWQVGEVEPGSASSDFELKNSHGIAQRLRTRSSRENSLFRQLVYGCAVLCSKKQKLRFCGDDSKTGC
jgi:hypothetical protein